MKRSNRILTGILVGIILLICTGFTLALSWKPAQPRTGRAPEDVAYNYFLALQREDMLTAYGYLYAHGAEYPETLAQFMDNSRWNFYNIPDGTIDTEVTKKSAYYAVVIVEVISSYSNNFFGTDYYSRRYKFELVAENSEWRILKVGTCYQDC